MILFLLLILLSSFSKFCSGFGCVYSEDSYEWSLDEFNVDKFKEKINGYESHDYNDYNDETCRVEIYIAYKSRLLVINFGDSFDWSELNHGELRLDSLIMFNEQNSESEYYNILEYACSNYDECNKLFVFNQIHWLIHVNYTLFETHLRSLLLNKSNKTEHCFIDKVNLGKCSSGVCAGRYTSFYQNYLSECCENSESPIEVHITTSMIVIDEHIQDKINVEEHKIIRYLCKFNQCNSQKLTDSLLNIVDKYFQLSLMKNALLSLPNIDSETDKIPSTDLNNENNGTSSFLNNSSYKMTSETEKQESSSRKPNKVEDSKNNFTEKQSFHMLINLICIFFLTLT